MLFTSNTFCRAVAGHGLGQREHRINNSVAELFRRLLARTCPLCSLRAPIAHVRVLYAARDEGSNGGTG